MLELMSHCFICVYWGEKYSVRYVEKLRAALRRNCSAQYPFVCLTDRPELFTSAPEIAAVKTPTDYPGWWQKVNLFDEALLPYRYRIFIDLDVVILRGLDRLIAGLDGVELAYAQDVLDVMSSSFMYIDSSSSLARDVVSGFDPAVWIPLRDENDQSYLGPLVSSGRYRARALRAEEHFSYKYLVDHSGWRAESKNSAYRPALLGDILMLNFHGEPKPHQLESEPRTWPLADEILPHW